MFWTFKPFTKTQNSYGFSFELTDCCGYILYANTHMVLIWQENYVYIPEFKTQDSKHRMICVYLRLYQCVSLFQVHPVSFLCFWSLIKFETWKCNIIPDCVPLWSTNVDPRIMWCNLQEVKLQDAVSNKPTWTFPNYLHRLLTWHVLATHIPSHTDSHKTQTNIHTFHTRLLLNMNTFGELLQTL